MDKIERTIRNTEALILRERGVDAEDICGRLAYAHEDAARWGVDLDMVLDSAARMALAWLYPELAVKP
jgi:hypothetical protein